jgi:hypothetical protein
MKTTRYAAFTALAAVLFCMVSVPGELRAGPVIYAVTYDRLIRIDLGTGAVTDIGRTGVFDAMGFTFGPDGTAYTVANNRLATVNLKTGKATIIGPTSAGMGLVFSPEGTLYGVGSGALWKVDPATGKATRVGTGSTGRPMDLAFHPDGTLYAIESASLYRLDLSTGQRTFVKNLRGLSNPMGLVITSDGTFYASDFPNPVVVRVDVTTGATTPVVNAKFAYCGMSLMPEPKLKIEGHAHEMILSWPAWASESFVLESSPAWPALEWEPLTAEVTVHPEFQSVTVHAMEPARFYRLRAP